jgi:hypothetical protein
MGQPRLSYHYLPFELPDFRLSDGRRRSPGEVAADHSGTEFCYYDWWTCCADGGWRDSHYYELWRSKGWRLDWAGEMDGSLWSGVCRFGFRCGYCLSAGLVYVLGMDVRVTKAAKCWLRSLHGRRRWLKDTRHGWTAYM